MLLRFSRASAPRTARSSPSTSRARTSTARERPRRPARDRAKPDPRDQPVRWGRLRLEGDSDAAHRPLWQSLPASWAGREARADARAGLYHRHLPGGDEAHGEARRETRRPARDAQPRRVRGDLPAAPLRGGGHRRFDAHVRLYQYRQHRHQRAGGSIDAGHHAGAIRDAVLLRARERHGRIRGGVRHVSPSRTDILSTGRRKSI